MRNRDFFAQITDFQHKLGIFLTFPFEKEVVERIRDHSSGRTVILFDYRHGDTLENNHESRVSCIPSAPMNSSGKFHAKLALLKGENKCRLLVGSMNLTRGSFRSAREICLSIDLEYSSEIYKGLVEFLGRLKSFSTSTLWGDVTKELRTKNGLSTKNNKVHPEPRITFIFNTEDKSISQQLSNQIRTYPRQNSPVIMIVSPFMSTDLGNEYENFIREIKPKEIRCYLRTAALVPKQFMDGQDKVKLYCPKTGSRKGFHAKMVLIDYGDRALAYIGSANFTRQGFFLNLRQGANQECGMILSLKEKKDIEDWLAKGWEDPVSPAEWKQSGITEQDLYDPEPYGYAERDRGGKNILVSFFWPKDSEERELKVKIDGDICRLEIKQKNFYQGEFKSSKSEITLTYKDKEIHIPVFDRDKFEGAKKSDGDSLFAPENSRIESTSEGPVRDAIAREGIRIKGDGGFVAIEPPLLEQMFHNFREQIKFIQKKKYFNESHFEELERKLREQKGGTGIYFASHLYRAFNKRGAIAKEFAALCLKRIKELLPTISISEEDYNRFLRRWQ